ncbi:MAG: hypothetical protein ACHQIM_18240 [Sphingobacteriales bacterium]
MRKSFLIVLSLFVFTHSYAQKIEVSLGANSGLFHYSGNGTTSSSFINGGQTPLTGGYPNYTWGNQNGFSYGANIQAQHVAKWGFIAGLQAGYDVLRSEAVITGVYHEANAYTNNAILINTPVKGTSVVQDQFINANPYLGYRLPLKKIKIDLLLGIDLGFGVNSFEKSRSVAADGTVYQTNVNYGKGAFEPRNRFGLAVSYKRFGITASYAHGIINHSSGLMNDSPIIFYAYSELVRFGLIYRIL